MAQLEKNYAEALFSLSKDENKLKEDTQTIKNVIEILKDNSDFVSLLSNRFLSNEKRIKVIDDVFKNQVRDEILALFHIIIENNRGRNFLDILNEFVSLTNDYFKVDEGIVYSAIKLSDKQIKALEKALSKKENKQISLKNRVNKDLIGGVKIIIGDRIYDGSLSTQIENIKSNLLA